jgi:hypothetical protein
MIRKLILHAILLLIIAVAAYPQSVSKVECWQVSMVSQVEGDSFKGYHKPGVLAGVFVQTDVIPTVFTGMEIKYSQKGSRRKIKPRDPEPEVYVMRFGIYGSSFVCRISHQRPRGRAGRSITGVPQSIQLN